MNRPLKSVTLIAAGVFAAGMVGGQVLGATQVSAATKHAKSHLRAKQTTGTGTATTTGKGTPHADGKVTAVNGNTITVQADNDPAGTTEYTKVTTIVLSSATTYRGTTTKASIVVGAYVVAEGTVSADGKTLTATSVGVGGPGGGHGARGAGHGGPHADGSVTAVNGNTISVKPDNDAAGSTEYTKVTTILLTASTMYEHGASKAAIVVGANIDAEGTLSSDGTTLTATQVGIHGNHA